jgi:hypothetical protein
MDQADIEGLAAWAYRRAGLEDDAPASPLELASRLLGNRVQVYRFSGLKAPAALARVESDWRIYVRGRLTSRALLWLTAHELGEYLLRLEHYEGPDAEQAADRLAAALRAPRRAYQRVARFRGAAWSDLAAAFRTSESSAALRWAEVTGDPVALIAPKRPIRTRGADFMWPNPIPRKAPHGLVRETLTDDCRRSVLRVA